MARHARIRCVILDRDGTLIEHIPYLSSPAQVRLLGTVNEGIRLLLDAGCRLFLHTNQSGIGRGYFSMDDTAACNREMLRQIDMGQSLFEGVCISPEAPGHTVRYRKPSPKYALEMASRHGFGRHEICYVGDNVTDLLAARNVGCDGVGVNTGLHDLKKMMDAEGLKNAYPIFDSFLDAARHVVSLGAVCR